LKEMKRKEIMKHLCLWKEREKEEEKRDGPGSWSFFHSSTQY